MRRQPAPASLRLSVSGEEVDGFLPVDEIYPNLTEYESFVFWSLKGMTVSQTERFEKLKNILSILDNTGLDIFDVNKNNELIPTEIFNGY